MRKIIIGCLAVALIGIVGGAGGALATDASKPTEDGKPPTDVTPPMSEAAPPAASGSSAPGDTMPPLDLVKKTEKGQLKNPYNDRIKDIADEGHKKYLSAGCNGCHGGGGGGGMCPPLTNDTWVYGADDDTLFRLVTLGSDELQKQGYKRVKHEVVTGPMPPFGQIIKTSDDLWKIIAFIRSVNPSSLSSDGREVNRIGSTGINQ
jgi:mono/diheme cytochrome c family protein